MLNEIPQNVKLGKGCIINSACQIIAEVGEIVIGDFTIIEEGCQIINNQLKKMVIGSYNTFEISCRIENTNIGDCNVFETKTIIESGCQVMSNCRFGISSKVPQKQIFEDFSRVYYPFNVLKVLPYDMRSHKEEQAELCLALLNVLEKYKKLQ